MTTYTVTVILDAKWIRQFRDGKMNLCTAFSVTSNYSKVSYNVIATHEGIYRKPSSPRSTLLKDDGDSSNLHPSSSDPVPLNTVSWNDDYKIAACKTGFAEGGMLPMVKGWNPKASGHGNRHRASGY
jgi:hypothetical protein